MPRRSAVPGGPAEANRSNTAQKSQVCLSSARQSFPIGAPSSFPRQPLHCPRHSLVWIGAAIGSDATLLRIHSIASYRIANSAHLAMDSVSAFVDVQTLVLAAHPWGFFSLSMQPPRGEASSLPILPLLSFPVNLILDLFSTYLSSIFLSSFLLHLTSPQLINFLYYISSRLHS